MAAPVYYSEFISATESAAKVLRLLRVLVNLTHCSKIDLLEAVSPRAVFIVKSAQLQAFDGCRGPKAHSSILKSQVFK